jgi:purine operon repressor
MSKWRRSARLIDITTQLIQSPHRLIPLSFFAERYGSAKSSISEDLAMIKEVMEDQGLGRIYTVAGAAGGVIYDAILTSHTIASLVQELCRELESADRILPGGYLYMSDILGSPQWLQKIGQSMASRFYRLQADCIMTVETKGIPLAHAVAQQLNLPVVVLRRDSKVTEGSVVSINYISGSSKRIQTMSLARRGMSEASRVLLIDDFMKMGGTISGMMDMVAEFRGEVVGIGVLVESSGGAEERMVQSYTSVARLEEVDVRERKLSVVPGNLVEQVENIEKEKQIKESRSK